MDERQEDMLKKIVFTFQFSSSLVQKKKKRKKRRRWKRVPENGFIVLCFTSLVGNGESVVDQLLRYLRCVCDDEIVGIEDHLPCLCSVVSILHLLFTSDSALAESLSSSE